MVSITYPSTNESNPLTQQPTPTTLYNNPQPNNQAPRIPQTHTVNLHTNPTSRYPPHQTVFSSTVQIDVFGVNNKKHTLRALLDSGSQSNFITESAFKKLNLQKNKVNMEVFGFNENVTQINHSCQLTIQSKFELFSTNLSFFIVPMICKLPSYVESVN